MALQRKIFDLAIGESNNNGGDIKFLGNDLAVVNGMENQVYLALFGGNVEQNTPSLITAAPTFDYWANNLLWPNRADLQFNSNTERVLNTTELSSAGRVKIENAVKNDLTYLKALGATVTVNVTLPGINMVQIDIKVIYSEGTGRQTIIKFGKVSVDGDFSVFDFNEDFF